MKAFAPLLFLCSLAVAVNTASAAAAATSYSPLVIFSEVRNDSSLPIPCTDEEFDIVLDTLEHALDGGNDKDSKVNDANRRQLQQKYKGGNVKATTTRRLNEPDEEEESDDDDEAEIEDVAPVFVDDALCEAEFLAMEAVLLEVAAQVSTSCGAWINDKDRTMQCVEKPANNNIQA